MDFPGYIGAEVAAALRVLPVIARADRRQEGKTPLLKEEERLQQRRYVSLGGMTALSRARMDQDALLAGDEDMIIDGSQPAHELFPAIKRSMDGNRRNGRLLLSGSADLLLVKSISESLAGCALYLGRGPFPWRGLEKRVGDLPLLIRRIHDQKPASALPFSSIIQYNFM